MTPSPTPLPPTPQRAGLFSLTGHSSGMTGTGEEEQNVSSPLSLDFSRQLSSALARGPAHLYY